MHVIDLTFERPVARMEFSCASGEIVVVQSQIGQANDSNQQDLQAVAEANLMAAISDQLAAVGRDLRALAPLVQSTAIEFAESFVGLLFDCDTDLARERILSSIKLALSEVDTTSGITIHLNPKMLNTAEQTFGNLAMTGLQFAPDPLLQLSDCRIEGSGQALIARLRRQLEAAKHQCLKNRNDESADS